jgi:hypothetical protein
MICLLVGLIVLVHQLRNNKLEQASCLYSSVFQLEPRSALICGDAGDVCHSSARIASLPRLHFPSSFISSQEVSKSISAHRLSEYDKASD